MAEEKMRLLPMEFKRKGTLYTQIEKNDKYVVYMGRIGDSKPFYEVFKYQTRSCTPSPIFNPYGWTLREVFPSDEDFGSWAWATFNESEIEWLIERHNLRA